VRARGWDWYVEKSVGTGELTGRGERYRPPTTGRSWRSLYALAVSAINGCESCVQAHEHAVVAGGLTEDHVHDAVRIAATVNAAAVALEMVEEPVEVSA
jgi:AhpD family alkylhydroperoxidase